MAFTGFAQNNKTKYQIGKTEETLTPLAGGIATAEPDFNEDTESYAYFDLDGGTETASTGKTFAFSIEGNRKYGDPAQELIRDIVFGKVSGDVWFQVTEPDGSVTEGPATVTGIKPYGGDANSRSALEATITFVGTPTDTRPTAIPEG